MNLKRIAHLLLVVVAAVLVTGPRSLAYYTYGWKWATLPVPYYINPANGDNILESSATAAIQSAADAWMLQANTPFSFHFAGLTNGTNVANNGRNEVFFRNASSGSAIATTYYWYSGSQALDADIVFWDGSYKFFTGSSGCSGGFYVEDVGTHEFGHVLGLGHSSAATATMASGAGWCATDGRSLDPDDIQGLAALYGGGGGGAKLYPPSVRIVSPTSGSTFPLGSIVTLSGTASDPEDGDLSSRIVWRSNLQGLLGNLLSSLGVSLVAGTHTITASVTDSHGATTEASVTLTIASGTTSGVVLTGTGKKVRGYQRADLRWTGAGSWLSVDVIRNGSKRATVLNLGSYSDNINLKGAASYTYAVCNAGTTTCSNAVVIRF